MPFRHWISRWSGPHRSLLRKPISRNRLSVERLEDRRTPALFSGPQVVINDSRSLGEVAGDFNGDGKLDLAVTGYSTNDVSVYLGDGNGGFSSATTFAVGTHPGAVAVGDFNGDGKLDLVVVNNNSSNFSVLLGTGTGGFSAATNIAVGTRPDSVAVADFNGDGKLDLAVANYGSNNVSVLLGTGTGSFSAATNIAVGTHPDSVAAADFNGDGALRSGRREFHGCEPDCGHQPTSCWDMGTAHSPRQRISWPAVIRFLWRWPISTATASPISLWPMQAATT